MSNGKQFGISLAPSFVPTMNAAGAAVGHGIVVMTPVVLGVAAGAAAVFLTRAALRGLESLAERERREAAATAANGIESVAWERTFAEVVIRNARVARLRAVAGDRADDVAALPAPFVYEGQSREEVAAHCRALDEALQAAERQVTDLRIEAAMVHPAVSGAGPVVRRHLQRTILRRLDLPGPDSGRDPSGPSSGAGPESPLQPVVDQILAGSAGRVGPQDLVELGEQAEKVLARGTKAELDELYLMAQEFRLLHQQREAEADQAARWLIGLAPLEEPAPNGEPLAMPPGRRAVLDALRDVVAERRSLDETLQAAAQDLFALARHAADDRAIAAILAQELDALGYDVRLDERGVEEAVLLRVTSRDDTNTVVADVETSRGTVVARFRTPDDADAPARADLLLSDWARDVRLAKKAADARHLCSGELEIVGGPQQHTEPETAEQVRPRPEYRERPIPDDE